MVTRGQLNTILFIIALIAGGMNLYRFYLRYREATSLPEFEVYDVRTYDGLEPRTLVHYQIRNVGASTALEVVTAVSPIDGNYSLPAYFESIPVGEPVSINRKILPGDYTKLRVSVYSLGFKETKFFTVVPDADPKPPESPDFIVYNLTLTALPEDNRTIYRADFGMMNIGGSPAHGVDVSLAPASRTMIPLLPVEEPWMITLDLESLSWEGVDVEISCDEGVSQKYLLAEYDEA
jgi:hypothetical protein